MQHSLSTHSASPKLAFIISFVDGYKLRHSSEPKTLNLKFFLGLLYDPILSSEIIKLDHLEVLCMAV